LYVNDDKIVDDGPGRATLTAGSPVYRRISSQTHVGRAFAHFQMGQHHKDIPRRALRDIDDLLYRRGLFKEPGGVRITNYMFVVTVADP
jgi:hypothetical protein